MHSFLSSPKATIEVLEEFGLYTKKSFGQHFLVDDNIIGKILELADISSDDTVIEVGPGIGTLTVALVQHAGSVVAVEYDEDLIGPLSLTVGESQNFALIIGDAVDVTAEQISKPFGEPVALVANLPYQVAATVVLRFFEMMPSLKTATVMVQTEVADRMSAHPGTKEYGAYTAKLNMLARSVNRFQVARSSFLPPPRVESTVIRIDRSELVRDIAHYHEVEHVINTAFHMRRKTLRNNLRGLYGMGSEDLDFVFDSAGIDGGVRAEMLDSTAFITLTQKIQDFFKKRS